MKKVLVGVGIGCGALVLIAVIGTVAAGIWARGKAEKFVARGDEIQKQEQRVTDMNQKYAFNAPPKGLPVELTDARLSEYLAIRASMTPVFKEYEGKAKKFDKKDQKDVSIGDAVEASGMLMDLMRDLRVKWLTSLDEKRMSPREFHAITAAIYTSGIGAAMNGMADQQRAALEQMKQLTEQQVNDPNLPAEQKDTAKQGLAEIEKQLAALPPKGAEPSQATKIHLANAKLVEKYKKQVDEDANMGLDLLLPGYVDESGLGKAMENIDMGNGTGTPSDDETGDVGDDTDEGAEAN